MRLYLFVKSSN